MGWVIDARKEYGLREGANAGNNTQALNDAIVKAKKTRKSLQLPSGYIELETVTYNPQVNLIGAGWNETILVATKAAPVLQFLGGALGAQELYNDGEMRDFAIDGKNIATSGMHLKNMAYNTMRKINIINVNGACLDFEGVLLADFYKLRFQNSKRGVTMKNNPSTIGELHSNQNTFRSCQWLVISDIGVEMDNGTSYCFDRCDFENMGTPGVAGTGALRTRNLSTEDPSSGVIGADVVLQGCWHEVTKGEFFFDLGASPGRTVIRDCPIRRTSVGYANIGIINRGTRLLVENSSLVQYQKGIITDGSGAITSVNHSDVSSHEEHNGGIYKQLQYV